MITKNYFPTYEFHIAKDVRKKYNVGDELFSINGNVVLADFRSVRLFAQKLNAKREEKERISAGQINAAGLMDEIYHFLFRIYEQQINPGVFKKALENLNSNLGENNTRKILFDFVSLFPPIDVYKGKISSFDYLNSYSSDRSNAEITIEEIVLLHIANFNPANKKLMELFDEKYFSDKELYKKLIIELDTFFQKEKKFGPDNQDIFSIFKTPILKNPDNIEAQLDFIREKYGILLDEKFLRRILSGKDLIKEEFILSFGGGMQSAVPFYKGESDTDFLSLGKSGYKYASDSIKDYYEPKNFTSDINWMPNVILIAKNVYVWLDQISKKYRQYIKTLDQIPDEELNELESRNYNGLWLIGIWERSAASKKIKHILGNIDAVSSAYSLYDYQIANDLGGEFAYNNLNERCRARGIRLASDMVPNHTGIYSKWIIKHPEYFIQSDYPPFPNYSFNGENLSEDWSVQLRIEDGYWDRRDAAVVFQRIDNNSGEVKYIYHGNDGTNMPWNDTAQLNMIRQDVREAIIQKILDVARKFSIIRFDAAMTLTKRHYSRLWYPEPGKGGDIPSRSEFALTKAEFDKTFPQEFWREVVDRINSEIPETLLLAEAFWLMEGYFVRSLGMHRVYNSAFMHMMMKEENAKYRDLITNTLEFEPEILKRYVNFMSNPDEETAIKQFGTDDKYFGVCALMVTLPGLPMFAHGQVEGYTEKYGMEYQRAYYNEVPNQWLVDRHYREIFPLMKKRFLFSEIRNFWCFDFYDSYGSVNENVFAFTNTESGERALVFYNNKYELTSGTIKYSSPKLMDSYGGKGLESKSISDALWIKASAKHFYIFRDYISNLEFIKAGIDLTVNGFYKELNAFKYKVFLDWKEVYDENGDWEKLTWKLGHNGVSSVQRAFDEMMVEHIHYAFEKLFDDESLDGFIKTSILEETDDTKNDRINFIDDRFNLLLNTIKDHFSFNTELKPILEKFEKVVISVRKLNFLLDNEYSLQNKLSNKLVHHAIQISRDLNYHDNSIIFMLWLILYSIKDIFAITGEVNNQNYIEKLLLEVPIRNILSKLGKGDGEVNSDLNLLKLLLKNENQFTKSGLSSMLDDECVKNYLQVNLYNNIWYYSKENFDEMLKWIFTFEILDLMRLETDSIDNLFNLITAEFKKYTELFALSDKSEYKYKMIKDML